MPHASSFRLASTRHYFDGRTQQWKDLPTTWITVKAYRGLSESICQSFKKGEPVIVRPCQRSHKRQAIVDGQRAVHMRGLRRVIRILFGELRRHELVVLVDELLGERLEIGLVLFGPPVVEFAVAVVLRALVVETVALSALLAWHLPHLARRIGT